MKCFRFQGLLMRNLRHQPQKQRAGGLASFAACGAGTKVPICAVGERDPSCSTQPFGRCPIAFPTGCWDGGRGNTWGLSCRSLFVGDEILKCSQDSKIRIYLKPITFVHSTALPSTLEKNIVKSPVYRKLGCKPLLQAKVQCLHYECCCVWEVNRTSFGLLQLLAV